MLNTSTLSPPTFLTQSATKLVVVTMPSFGSATASWDAAGVGAACAVGSAVAAWDAAGAEVACAVGSALSSPLSEQAATAKSSAMVNTADFHKPDTHLLVCSLIVVLRSFRLSMSMAAVDTPVHGSYIDTEYQYMSSSF